MKLFQSLFSFGVKLTAKNMKIEIDRDSVAAGDDMESHSVFIKISDDIRVKDLIKKAKKACPFASICGGEATWIIYVGSHEEKKCIGVSAQQWSEDRLLVSKDITAKSVFEGIENKMKFYYWAQNDPNEVFETLKQGKEPIR